MRRARQTEPRRATAARERARTPTGNAEPGPEPGGCPPAAPRPGSAPPERFRRWVLLLGAALIPPNSLWIARTEALDYSGFPTCMSLFCNVVFTLMVLLLLNALARQWFPRRALSRQEMIVVYGMVATGSSLVGHDYMQMLVPTIPHVAYFGNPGNHWASTIAPLLPRWLAMTEVSDPVRAYELGHSSLYTWEHLRAWLPPIAAWSVFLIATLGATLSLSLLLRRHWVENERLSYPIVQIPLLITEGGGANRVFRSPLFWGGFAASAALDMLNGLHQFFPALPAVPLKVQDIGPFFAPYPPWNALGWLPISFYPFAIGLSFLMPTNLSFSCWFFFFARKAQQVYCAARGYTDADPWYPYLREQSYGAWIALFVGALWFSRGYLREALRAAWTGAAPRTGDLSYRFTLLALGLCVALMVGFLLRAGMSPALAVAYVVLYLLFCGAAARARAEVGPPTHEIGWVGTSYMVVMALGTVALGPKNLALFSLLHFQNRMHRGLLMPQQAESLKGASQSGLRIRVMAGGLALAGVVGVLAAFWAMLHLSYGRTYATAVHPAAPGSAFAAEHFNQLSAWLSTPAQPNRAGVFAVAIGAMVVFGLARLSVAFHAFPFHPAGYALGMSFGLDYIWLPVTLSWAVKAATLRWWGLKGYRAALPLFVGLVLGEFAVGGMWSFIRGVLGVQTYTFYI